MRSMVVAVAIVCGIPAASASAQPATTQNPVSDAIRSDWKSVEQYIRDSADIMAAPDYAFRPVESVRTFGQILAHVAGANYVFCSAARGEKSPHAEDEFEKSLTAKADIVKALNESLAYCDTAFKTATDASLGEMVNPPFGSAKVARASTLVGNVGHLNEHYGNLVTYFRIKGIVPPSSRRQ